MTLKVSTKSDYNLYRVILWTGKRTEGQYEHHISRLSSWG